MRAVTYTTMDILLNGVWNVATNLKLVIACLCISQVIALAKVI